MKYIILFFVLFLYFQNRFKEIVSKFNLCDTLNNKNMPRIPTSGWIQPASTPTCFV